MTRDRARIEASGRRAEDAAAFYLRLKGYSIKKRRYKTPVGEIDIVAKKGHLITFVEVKKRRDKDIAAHSVTHRQQARITDAARYFLAQQDIDNHTDLRFDVILIAPWTWPSHIKNAFEAGGS